ncbi:unnamed protein product [Kuraishia capsulata CBS 1993]|uniref:RNA helicase n=1 Tax=Kuraishia capsulata CBS 1993 TaxID=1382522 RepID=W6MM92_9ASCO|nr:uncharacterized protein KUCA_T00003630001 [Kuraishia capsulata CBS 1993]CDK27651.1 unnamed protein product [Kuraishia capsulata CBS 1993]
MSVYIRGFVQLGVRNYATRRKVSNSFRKNKALENPKRHTGTPPYKKDPRPRREAEREKPKVEPHAFKIGRYPGLKLPDEDRVKGLHGLVSKIDDFRALRLLPEIRDVMIQELSESTVLKTQNFISPTKKVKSDEELHGLKIRPTPIQIAAIKSIQATRVPANDRKVFTLAAETGSGKTWAYLAPLLHKLKEEQLTPEWGGRAHKAAIRSVILLPTHELVDQVYEVVSKVAVKLELNAFRWDTESNFKVFLENFKSRIDIMVTTPAKLLSLTKYDSIGSAQALLQSVRYCVVDEADTLMDKSWIDDTRPLLNHMQYLVDLVFVSATIPSEFNKTMGRVAPNAIPVTTPSLHRLPAAIDFKIVDASVSPYKGSKIKALAQALYSIHCDGTEKGYEKRVIVFTKEKTECEIVATKLRNMFGHDVVAVSSQDPVEERRAKVKAFVEPPRKLEDTETPPLKVLVCTDLLARGMNFVGIRNVILWDVPNTSIDLIHRAGRTGRMNQSGRVFMIIDKKTQSLIKGLPKVLRYRRRLG